jgi:hypothetical protein
MLGVIKALSRLMPGSHTLSVLSFDEETANSPFAVTATPRAESE